MIEIILLFLACIGFVIHLQIFALISFAVHFLLGLKAAVSLSQRQPLSAIFLIMYIGMYFGNPVVILLNLMPLESSTSWDEFFVSNSLLLLGFDLALLAMRRLRFVPNAINEIESINLDESVSARVVINIIALCMFAEIVLVAYLKSKGVSAFTVSRTFRVTSAGSEYLIVGYILALLPLAAFLVGLSRRPIQIIPLISIISVLAMHFFIYRTRNQTIATFLAYIIGLIVRRFFVFHVYRRFNLQLKAKLAVALICLTALGISAKYIRSSISIGDLRFDRDRVQRLIEDTFHGGDLGYALMLRLGMNRFPEKHDYLYGQSYYRILFVPIPRIIWPDKPANTQQVFAAVLDSRNAMRGRSIPAGIVGDLYINFGPYGVFGMLVFGLLFAQERYRSFSDLLYLAGSGIWMTHLVRGGFTNPITTLIFIWVAAWFLIRAYPLGTLTTIARSRLHGIPAEYHVSHETDTQDL